MSEAKKPNTEQLILDAAEEEFLIKGFDGARTTAIAEKAGVTHAMLHYYFRTKEQLFERIVAKISEIVARTIIVAMGDPRMPVLDRIRSGIASHFDLIVDNPLLPRFFLNEVVLRPERYHMLQETLREELVSMIAGLQREIDNAAARGEMADADVRMLLLSIVSLNVFPFTVMPFAGVLLGDLTADKERFLKARKEENIEIIMRRLKKQ